MPNRIFTVTHWIAVLNLLCVLGLGIGLATVRFRASHAEEQPAAPELPAAPAVDVPEETPAGTDAPWDLSAFVKTELSQRRPVPVEKKDSPLELTLLHQLHAWTPGEVMLKRGYGFRDFEGSVTEALLCYE